MVIFCHTRGGVQPFQNPEITFFSGKIFKLQGGSGPPVPPLDPRMPIIVIVIRNGCFKGSDQIRRIPSVQSKMHHENMSMQ